MNRISKKIVDCFLENPQSEKSRREFTESISTLVYNALDSVCKNISKTYKITEENKKRLLDAFVCHMQESGYLKKKRNEIAYAIEENNLDFDVAILCREEDIPTTATKTESIGKTPIDKWITEQSRMFMESKIYVEEVVKYHEENPENLADARVLSSFRNILIKVFTAFCVKYKFKHVTATDIAHDFFVYLKKGGTYYNSIKNFDCAGEFYFYLRLILKKYFGKYVNDSKKTVIKDLEKTKKDDNNDEEHIIEHTTIYANEEDEQSSVLYDKEDEGGNCNFSIPRQYVSVEKTDAYIEIKEIIEYLKEKHPLHAKVVEYLLENERRIANGEKKLKDYEIAELMGVHANHFAQLKSQIKIYAKEYIKDKKRDKFIKEQRIARRIRAYEIATTLKKN